MPILVFSPQATSQSHNDTFARSPGLKQAVEDDLGKIKSKLVKHRDILQDLLERDQVGLVQWGPKC